MHAARFILPVLFATTTLTAPSASRAQMALSITIAPPALLVYAQPEIPGEGYLWTPGYWAYGEGGYYWVAGEWVQPPQAGFLWTPGYWGWNSGVYAFNAGYWGPHVGFYGGIDYGFGYGGNGYDGGRWNNGAFVYNRAANNFGHRQIVNVYNAPLMASPYARMHNVSYNGGNGGVPVHASASEVAFGHERHVEATPQQSQHMQAARSNPQTNRGPQAAAPTQHAEPGAQARPAPSPHPVARARAAPEARGPQARAAAPPQTHAAPQQQQRAAPQPQAHAAPQPQARTAPPQQSHAAPCRVPGCV